MVLVLPLKMNYLAHAALSFGMPAVLAGNMISDHVKGRTQFDLPADVQVGIKLHRAIDNFTDHHKATKNIMALFRPQYRLYSGAFTDIVYDYFLANDNSEFETDSALLDFTSEVYTDLDQYISILPAKFAGMFPYMKSQNWLYNYRLDEGMQKSFGGLARRAAYLDESEIAFQIFLDHKAYFLSQYHEFYPSVKNFAVHTLERLLKK